MIHFIDVVRSSMAVDFHESITKWSFYFAKDATRAPHKCPLSI